MRKWLIPLASFLAVLVSGGLSQAQDAKALAAQREALKKLDSWVGEWKGTGWTRLGAEKHDFTITETVQPKLDSLVLLVEGLGKRMDPATGKEVVGHNALAVISYDDKAKQYRFRHYTAQGRFGESELKVTDGGYEWGMSPEGSPVKVRFTIKMDGKKWEESGEFSPDGNNWTKFMEMSLEKQPAKAK